MTGTNSLGMNVTQGKVGTFFTRTANGQNSIQDGDHQIPTTIAPIQQEATTTTDSNSLMASMMRGQMMQQTLGMAFQGLGQLGSLFGNAGEKKNKKKDGDEDSQLAENRPKRRSAREEWDNQVNSGGGCANGQCGIS